MSKPTSLEGLQDLLQKGLRDVDDDHANAREGIYEMLELWPYRQGGVCLPKP